MGFRVNATPLSNRLKGVLSALPTCLRFGAYGYGDDSS